MSDDKDLEKLLLELKCKISADNISDDLKTATKVFLKKELKARTEHRRLDLQSQVSQTRHPGLQAIQLGRGGSKPCPHR
jgi:hypothetical protein